MKETNVPKLFSLPKLVTKYTDNRMVLKKGRTMLRQIEQVLDDQIRPALASHGGDIEVIDFENKKLVY